MRLLLLILLLTPATLWAEAPRVLFDQGHRQAFFIERQGLLKLSSLAEVMRDQGWQVASSQQPLDDQLLAGVSALIISGPFQSFSSAEIDSIISFVEQGGRLAIMLHINQTLLPLLHRLGVDAGNLVINEQQNQIDGKTIDFKVTNFVPHPLTEGLEQFSIYGGWPLQVFAPPGETLASSSPHSWVDLDQNRQLSQQDLMQPFAVLIAGELGQGSFAVFADDAIFQNQFLSDGNRRLAINLARWLLGSKGVQLKI
ncbi:MAG TPA: DUF4350 domain-containing protein [Malonomonas sp.]